MDSGRERSSFDALGGDKTSSVQPSAYISPILTGAVRLKTPVWESNTGHTGSLSPGSHPRRSKKSQRSTAERSQSRTSRKPGGRNEPLEDDISPSTSAGAGTPRLTSPEPPVARRNPVSSVQHPERYLSATQNIPKRAEEGWQQDGTSASVRSTSRVAELRNVFDQKRHSAIPGDGTFFQPDTDTDLTARLMEVVQPSNHSTPWRPVIATKRESSRPRMETRDDEITSTCAIFTNPFRRGSASAMPSPVWERIRIFEGLSKPGTQSPQTADSEYMVPRSHGSNSQPFLAGTGFLESKKRPVGWMHNPFRKRPLHMGESRLQSEDRSRDTEQSNEAFGRGKPSKTKNGAFFEQLASGGPSAEGTVGSGNSNGKPQVQH